MAFVNKAKFTINGNAADNLGYDAVTGEALSLALENAQGVLSVTYQVYNPSDPESPLASTGALNLTFTANSLPSYSPPTPATAAALAMPSSFLFGCAWIFRATVALDNGATQVFERMVTLKLNRARAYVPGETTQYSARGWGDALSQLIRDFNMYHAPSGIQTSGAGAATFPSMLRGPRGCAYYVSAVFSVCRFNTPTDAIFWFVEAGYTADATNTVTQRIAPAVVKKRDLSAGALVIPVDPTINIVSNQLQPQVTGIAATTLYWQVRWDVFLCSSLTY